MQTGLMTTHTQTCMSTATILVNDSTAQLNQAADLAVLNSGDESRADQAGSTTDPLGAPPLDPAFEGEGGSGK
jgi:hypothetical protein